MTRTEIIVVGSTNPVKLQSAREGFAAMFPDVPLELHGVEAASGVSDQPFEDEETLKGAHQRALNAWKQIPNADYAIGIEGGVARLSDEDLMAFAWVVVLNGEKIGRAKSGAFVLPREITTLIRQGMELGHADDVVFGKQDSKRRNGSIGLLTDDALTRTGFYSPAVLMALIPFKNPILTFG
ncbi:MAG TPA: inosine/xanthosine triphosphatase, partial [Phototrophicaceae bacterium]|jgi:inosine/xanthosine triphosphatase|nr:inosine/xanthosine triphosphatase [Phototrophicaceae bacterium]